jgi:hypothetical protein
MSKTETAKALFKHLGYLFGGMSLLLMTLFLLGHVMDELVQIFGLTTMPFLVSLIPLVIFLTGVAWGGYFIWKGIPAVDIAFDLICKLADVIVLNRMSHKAKVLVGGPPLLSGVVILIVAMIQTGIRTSFFAADNTTLSDIATPLWPIGLGLLLFGLVVIPKIKRQRMEQKSDET